MIQKYRFKQSSAKSSTVPEEQLALWYDTPLGHYLVDQLAQQLDAFLSTSFGYFALVSGCHNPAAKVLESCRVKHVYRLGQTGNSVDVKMNGTSFPVASDSTDLVVLMHALSQSSEPHAILREVNRVLIQDGRLIIIDFNPVSLWGLRHVFQSWLDVAPWGGHYYSASRFNDWAFLLGFEPLHHFQCGHVLPLNYQKVIDRSHIMTKFMQRWLAFSSALNVLVYEKNTIPLTPIRKQWVKRQVLQPKVARPSVGRDMKYDRK
jgi:SAM-dependent methyltransferase